jgi:hypothetical protein
MQQRSKAELDAKQAELYEETVARKAAQEKAKLADEAAAAQQAELDAKQAELDEKTAAQKAVQDEAKLANEEMRKGMFRDLELQKTIEELRIFKINPRSLTLSALPDVNDISSLKSSTSSAAERMKVTVVKPLHGFKNMRREYTLSILADLECREDVHNIPPETLRDGMRQAGS